MDSYFDVPAGYNDADLEMRALEDAGNRAARRYRGITLEQRAELAAGRTITATAKRKDGPSYEVQVRANDADYIGPCDFTYSINGTYWYPSPKAARLAGWCDYCSGSDLQGTDDCSFPDACKQGAALEPAGR